jgi:hypothetical protein
MEKAKIQENLDKANRMLSTAKKMNMPESAINKAQSEVDKYTKELAEFKDETKEKSEKKTKRPKVSRPPMNANKAKKTAAKKVKVSRPAKKVKTSTKVAKGKSDVKPAKSEKTVTFNGKTYTDKDKEFCEVLLKKWHGRKASMKKSSKKFKTKTISHKIGSDVASAVTKTIDHVYKTKEKEIEKNPKVYATKFARLESSANKFLSDIKAILGSDYKSSQIKSEMDNIEKAVIKLLTIQKKHKK